MPFYFDAFTLVIAREHPSCTAPLQLPYLDVSEGSSKCLNTGMITIYHAASSYLSFLLFTRIESRAVKQESKQARAHDAENTNNLRLEHGVRAISRLCKKYMGHDKVPY